MFLNRILKYSSCILGHIIIVLFEILFSLQKKS